MSAAESAASLFGDDSSADPFASIGEGSSDTSTFPDFLSQDSSVDSVGQSSFFDEEAVAAALHTKPVTDYGPPATSNPGLTNGKANYGSQYASSAYAPATFSGVQNVPPAAAFDGHAPVKSSYEPTTAIDTATQAYNPYAPAAASSPSSSTGTQAYTPYSPARSAYSLPPVPPVHAQPATNAYAPAASASAHHTPSSYAIPPLPSAPSQPTYNAYTPTAPTSAYNAPFASTPAPKPPVVSSPSLNRPKVSNAYDPPFPTSRPARRGTSGSSVAPTYSAYSSPPLPSQYSTPPPQGQFSAQGHVLPSAPPVGSVPSASGWSGHLPPTSAPTPPPPRPQSSNYGPPPGRKTPAFVPVDNALRSASPALSSGLPPLPPLPRPNSVSSHASVDPHSYAPNRTSSPASFSVRSATASPDAFVNGQVLPEGLQRISSPVRMASPARMGSPAFSVDRARSPSLSAAPPNPYLPGSSTIPRAPSPLKKSTTNGASPYLPPNTNHVVPPPPMPRRTSSSGSVYSTTSSSPEQLYSSHGHGKQPRSEAEYGNYTSRYNYGSVSESSPYNENGGVQEITVKTIQPTAYAPSPSLLGANDPLGRTSSRAPVFSFGFGGKFLTCFHGASMNTGFDVALASRISTSVTMHVLNKIIPESALEVSSAVFPGPLFSDPGSPTTGLVRATASTQTKTKKTKVIKYLADRMEEISLSIGYLNSDSVEGRQAEGKLVLFKMVKILVENDGKLTGTAQIDAAVRTALVPKLELASEGTDEPQVLGFAAAADIARDQTLSTDEAPLATSVLRSSSLDKIQDFLLRGERRKAYHYALDERLWAHAMVIASSIDREAWKEVVNEFLKTELNVSKTLTPGPDASPVPLSGREGLRVAYSLYSGQGSACVQELVPQNLLSRATARLQVPATTSHLTPMTPNFAAPAVANSIPVQSLAAWPETVAMMLTNPMSPEIIQSLTALGDQLLAHQWVEAAHVCYLLTGNSTLLGGVGNPNARVVLLGSRSPQVWPSFYKDADPIILTEILEFSLSLNVPSKGQEPFVGFPHLQAYKFIRALSLAEIGQVQLANRYCEAITACLSRPSPFFTPVMVDQLKALTGRIVGLDHGDKSGFWKGTPSLDTIGRFLEGRFTKLVTGDVDPATPIDEQTKMSDAAAAGPFAGYSTISNASSAAPSASPSPQPSLYHAYSQPGLKPVPPPVPIDRASSAMEHVRPRPAQPRVASANASTTSFSQAPSFVSAYTPNAYSPNPYSPSMATPKPTDEEDTTGQEVSWWGSSYGTDSAQQTPMASTFMKVDAQASSDGFVSLMDANPYSVAAPVANGNGKVEEEDDEDLGFGNSKPKPKPEQSPATDGGAPTPQPAVVEKRPAAAPAAAQGGSWFGRFWKKSDATPGPVKANLGEETSFYYDAEQKRWVNKKAGAEAAKPETPTPPPPPSRPQTASPGMLGARAGGATPPPPRSASVADGPAPPKSSTLRVRSSLAPTPESTSMPSSPLRQASMTPPPGRPKSQASKRAIRSRYVDVFQQPE